MTNRFKIILAGVVAVASFAVAGISFAAPGGISAVAGEHYAWTDVSGWIDFANTIVDDTNLSGTASAQQLGPGTIVMNCVSAPISNCGAPAGSWYVANDGAGNLSGWAWSDVIGWVSFCGGAGTANCPGAQAYQVKIDPTNGDFSGYAWNDVVGWIALNCHTPEGVTCAHDYKVKTSWTTGPVAPTCSSAPCPFDDNTWLISSVFNTQVAGGAALNTISWQGTLNGGHVGFQIAASNNPAGPWNYYGPSGDTTTAYETTGPGVQLSIAQAAALRRNTNNNQYFRYKIWLAWNLVTPQVNDVIISYSP